jgi:hypothetical protein
MPAWVHALATALALLAATLFLARRWLGFSRAPACGSCAPAPAGRLARGRRSRRLRIFG